MNKIACPRCGGHLVMEEFGQYGMAYKISYNGKIQKRATFNDYGGNDIMENEIYCPACKWSKTAGIAITYDRERYFSKITLHKQKNSKNLTIWRLAMKLDGIQAAEQMAISKMMLFPYIFRHNKVLASEFLLCNILEKLLEGRTTNTIHIKHPMDMLLYTDSDLLCYSCKSRDAALNRQIECLRFRIFPRIAFALSKNVCLNPDTDKTFKKNFAKIKQLAKTRDKGLRKSVAKFISNKASNKGYTISMDELEIFYTKSRNVFEKMASAPVINYTEKMEEIKDRWLMRNWEGSGQSDNDIIYFYVPAYNARFAFNAIAEFLKERYHFDLNLDLVRENIKLVQIKRQE